MASKALYYSRKWLNPRGTAFITCEVWERTSNAEVSIADCSRIITLDIRNDQAGQKKLNLLISELFKLRDHMFPPTQ